MRLQGGVPLLVSEPVWQQGEGVRVTLVGVTCIDRCGTIIQMCGMTFRCGFVCVES